MVPIYSPLVIALQCVEARKEVLPNFLPTRVASPHHSKYCIHSMKQTLLVVAVMGLGKSQSDEELEKRTPLSHTGLKAQ